VKAAQSNRFHRIQRQVFDISSYHLSCKNCGEKVSELPFRAEADSEIVCDDCKKDLKNKEENL
jgi:predicted SprT family Zn-dependent metalloprotease